MLKHKVLFILKRRHDYDKDKHSEFGMSTGLYNSAWYMNEMLQINGVDSKIVVVEDNNKIDKEVSEYKPTDVIIEALWVVPSKFEVLQKLHPTVKWIVRLHSDIPFLANEGIAMDWLGDYSTFRNVYIAANSKRIYSELKTYYKNIGDSDSQRLEDKIIYLPNYYPQVYKQKEIDKDSGYIDIGCFGVVRPMKNHLIQAIATIKFADKTGKKLRFHINSGRVEQRGDTVLNNLKNLFAQIHNSGHILINHGWMPRNKFLKLCRQMDIGLQVSFSETFNIVLADLVSQGVPVVGSTEIPWLGWFYKANPTNSNDIYRKLLLTYYFPKINNFFNQKLLHIYTQKTEKIWLHYFK